MQHIALITTSYPESKPGTESAGSFVEDFATELARRVRVSVVAAASESSLATRGDLSVRRFAVPRLPLSLLSPANPGDWVSIVASLRAGQRALDALAEDDPPDHILALWALPSGYWARRVAGRLGVGYSTWALGSDIWSLGRKPVVRRILATVLKDAEHRYADGLKLARDVESIAGRPCEFLASTRRLPPRDKEPRTPDAGARLAFLGRWHPNKGTDLMLDALGHLQDDDWQRIEAVRIFGGGPLEDMVRQSANSLEAQGRPVSVGGYLDKSSAADLIAWADYLMLPSRIESIPVIFSDAMQLQTPVIATPVGDLPGIFRDTTVGPIASAANAVAYAAAIHEALHRDPTDYAAGIEQAQKTFDLSNIVDRFVADLLGGAR